MISQYIIIILEAGVVTVRLALTALLISVILGLFCAVLKVRKNVFFRGGVELYTFFARGIPDLVLMLFVFYSLPALINDLSDRLGFNYFFEISPFTAGAGTLGFILGAYMTGTFYNSIINLSKYEIEAAQAFGFSRIGILSYIILPQFVRLSLPGFTNNWLVLIKATALVSLLGLEDLMSRSRSAAEATSQPFTFYLVAAAFYFGISLMSVLILRKVSHKYGKGTKEINI